jgi:hypothetical protein
VKTSQPAFLGIFSYLDDLVQAVETLRAANLDFTVFSPTARPEIRAAIRMKPSAVRYFTLCGGLLGIISGLALAVYTVLQYRFIVSGKPIVPWIPFVVIAFEFCILLGVLITLTGLAITAKLPRLHLPPAYDPRFSVDRFGVLVPVVKIAPAEISAILTKAGAVEVREVGA